MTTPSHRLKLDRAEKHFMELDSLLASDERRVYPVSESFETQGKKSRWVYRLDLSAVAPDESFPVILGELLYNVRSALDHLVVAIAPVNRKSKTSFPINTKDPVAIDPQSGDYLDAEAARFWLSQIKGLPADCVTALKWLQPFEAANALGKPADDHPLAILSALQNADKHRQLVGVTTGLQQATLTVAGVAFSALPILVDGAVVEVSPTQVQVDVEGHAVVGVGGGQKVRGFYEFIDRLFNFILNEVLPRLEPLL